MSRNQEKHQEFRRRETGTANGERRTANEARECGLKVTLTPAHPLSAQGLSEYLRNLSFNRPMIVPGSRFETKQRKCGLMKKIL
jgi:hypothetical protein